MADAASAYYSPRMGRFLSRDPIDEPGAMVVRQAARQVTRFIPRDPIQTAENSNNYRFVDNNPVIYVDPTGLWKIERDGGEYAYARADPGDTIEKLASIIGLEANDYEKWLTQFQINGYVMGSPWPTSVTQQLPGCSLYKIPNTVIAWWAGVLGGFGKGWVMWDTDVGTFNKRGFHVIETDPGTAGRLEGLIAGLERRKQLHGWFSWSHGYVGGILTDADQMKALFGYDSDYANWHPRYRMAIGIIFACESASARNDFSSNAIFWGKNGTLVPHGAHLFGPTVAHLVPPARKAPGSEAIFMVRGGHMRLVVCPAIAIFALTGCNSPNQRAWHYTLLDARREVNESISHKGVPVQTKQLVTAAGQPDARAPVTSLLDRITWNREYQAFVKDRLERVFDNYSASAATQPSDARGKPTSMASCTLWLYDESKHFSRPYRTSAQVGYAAYFFLVWNSEVIGAEHFVHWRGLDKVTAGE